MRLEPTIKKIYDILLSYYGPQGWWPIVNNKTLMCEYHTRAPKNENEQLEVSIGALLAQGTQWYPNVVRAIQQLKIGRPFIKEELKLVQYAERLYHKEFGNRGCKIDKPINDKIFNNKYTDIISANISGNKQIITKDTILTQNTAWRNVEKALSNLKENNLLSKNKLKEIDIKKLAEVIKSSGYNNQKAKKIKEFIKFIDSGKEIDRTNLLNVWGIGKETADSILLYAYREPMFVIDAYTKRIMNRIGYKEESYDELQELFMNNLPKDDKLFNEFHALLVELGKNICKKEPLCEKCPLNAECNYFKNKSLKEFDK